MGLVWPPGCEGNSYRRHVLQPAGTEEEFCES
jgi:hypothetical protein